MSRQSDEGSVAARTSRYGVGSEIGTVVHEAVVEMEEVGGMEGGEGARIVGALERGGVGRLLKNWMKR